MWKKLAVVAFVAWAGYHAWDGRTRHVTVDVDKDFPLAFSPALSLSRPPIQRRINSDGDFYEYDGHAITPLASFQLEAKVLSTKGYTWGREADFSPVDFALGWGPMADDTVLERIEISQSGRWYQWRTSVYPIPRRSIETSSANMHLIPSSPDVASTLHQVEPGHVVRLLGYLVEVKSPDGWQWRSSLTRDDTGDGACEVVLVKKVVILHGVHAS